MVATLSGVALAVLVLPKLSPALANTLTGERPIAFWYLCRASGLVAYVLLWASVLLGLLLSSRWARRWPGSAVAFDLHQHTGLTGLAFSLFHALVLLGDEHTDFGIGELLFPLVGGGADSGWIGLGQVALWLGVAVTVSSTLRKGLGPRSWRLIHAGSYTLFVLALVHGLVVGSETEAPWARVLYALTGGAVLVGTAIRLATARPKASTGR